MPEPYEGEPGVYLTSRELRVVLELLMDTACFHVNSGSPQAAQERTELKRKIRKKMFRRVQR
jgi:hypothetical protein